MADKVHYSELGLVNTREMFKEAMAGEYAIPAYNFNNLEQLQAIITACAETSSPVIIQVSKGARSYANETMLRYMALGAVKMAREKGSRDPDPPPPGPRRLLRALPVLRRFRVFLGHDRRFPPSL